MGWDTCYGGDFAQIFALPSKIPISLLGEAFILVLLRFQGTKRAAKGVSILPG